MATTPPTQPFLPENDAVTLFFKNSLIMLDEIVRFSPNILIISTMTIYFIFNDKRALILLFGFAINILLNFFLVFLIKAKRPSEGLGCSANSKCCFNPSLIPRSATGKMSGRFKEKIKNISAVQRPIPLTSIRILIMSSSLS